MYGSCGECDRLWREYGEMLKDYLRLAGQQQIAAIRQDSATLAQLDPLVCNAREKRRNARKAVRDHDAMHSAKALATRT